ncbi:MULTISPECIES: hypothetical protein [Paenibacillus]|nr:MULTISPECIES: hypothetical protein [Paenibacillus]
MQPPFDMKEYSEMSKNEGKEHLEADELVANSLKEILIREMEREI